MRDVSPAHSTRGFQPHAASFVVGIIALFIINYFTTPSYYWGAVVPARLEHRAVRALLVRARTGRGQVADGRRQAGLSHRALARRWPSTARFGWTGSSV